MFLKYLNSESYYKNSLLLECIQHFKHLMKGRLLDLGCGNKPYSNIYSEVCDSSVGCDVPFSLHKNSNVEVLCYAEDIDRHFEPDQFDCVICTEVLEHTVNDNKVIENINKVLKKNGNLIISAPFTYVLHEAPHDYRRYTLYGLKNILENNNFEVKSGFSMGVTFSSGFFIYYYALKKTFYYSLKKIGFKNLNKLSLLNAVAEIPEWLFYKFNISSFRKKLEDNRSPSVNEMYSSLGYFIVARKINDI
ncbi:MAG: class I SAM-dependent methyltransferase [Ignavibacteria bacterium]|nr:class I SAM-dependent methyltransferase [Ignavibacteria bacterium]